MKDSPGFAPRESPSIIERHDKPSHLDTAARYTLCFVSEDEVWVQVAHEEENPKWIEFSSLEKAVSFIHQIKNNDILHTV